MGNVRAGVYFRVFASFRAYFYIIRLPFSRPVHHQIYLCSVHHPLQQLRQEKLSEEFFTAPLFFSVKKKVFELEQVLQKIKYNVINTKESAMHKILNIQLLTPPRSFINQSINSTNNSVLGWTTAPLLLAALHQTG